MNKNKATGDFTAGVNVDVNIDTASLIQAGAIILVAGALLVTYKVILKKLLLK